MSRLLHPAVALLLLLTLPACTSTRAYHDPDPPWVGPDKRPRAVVHEWSDLVTGQPQRTIAWRWGLCSELRADRAWFPITTEYLASQGINTNPLNPAKGDRPYDASVPDPIPIDPDQRFPRTHTLRIVSVDPMIVVAVPVKPEDDRTFQGGARLPYHPTITWFSPDLRRRPQPPLFLSPDEACIPVRWGTLLITREGEEWVVTASSIVVFH